MFLAENNQWFCCLLDLNFRFFTEGCSVFKILVSAAGLNTGSFGETPDVIMSGQQRLTAPFYPIKRFTNIIIRRGYEAKQGMPATRRD